MKDAKRGKKIFLKTTNLFDLKVYKNKLIKGTFESRL